MICILQHYPIKIAENSYGGGISYYIFRRVQFYGVRQLLLHYHERADGLCVNLRAVCKHAELPQAISLKSVDDDHSDSSYKLVEQASEHMF